MLSLDGHARLLDPRAWPIHALSFVVAGILQSYFVLTVFDHYASASISPYVVDTLFIFYQPLLVTLSMLWFWVVVVRFFEAYAVKFDACFMPEHHRHLMLSSHICEIATCMTLVVSGSMALFVHLCATGALLAASYQPSLLYIFLVGMWCMPLDILHREDRLFYATTLRRVVLPIQTVFFTDFLLADILTSLAKPISDLGLAACHMFSSRPLADSLLHGYKEGICDGHSLQVPAMLLLPYAWRLVQCVIIAHQTGNKDQLYNAAKYFSAFPVICLSFVKYSVSAGAWTSFYKPLWVLACIFNNCFTYYWDLEHDWDIKLFTSFPAKPLLKTEVRMFRSEAPYYWLMGSNLLLRISWTYKLSSHMRHMRWFVLVVQLAECFRRFQWSFVRIEKELRKLQSQNAYPTPLIPGSARHKDYQMVNLEPKSEL